MKKKIREVLSKYRQNNGYTMEHAERELLDLFSVMCYAGDEVRENGTDIWYKVKRVDGRDVYLDYEDGLDCLDIKDIIEVKHCT